MSIDWKPKAMPTLSSSAPGGAKLIDFTEKVFGARAGMRFHDPAGNIVHAEIHFGDDALVMTGAGGPGGALPPGLFHVYVREVDAVYKHALAEGATSEQEPTDQFYGDRVARVADAFGNRWSIATHVEDVTEEEMHQRLKKLMGGG